LTQCKFNSISTGSLYGHKAVLQHFGVCQVRLKRLYIVLTIELLLLQPLHFALAVIIILPNIALLLLHFFAKLLSARPLQLQLLC